MQLSDGDNAKNIDLNYFANASGAAPGEYTVDVVMNGELVDRQIKIDFFRAGQQAERQTDASTVGTLGN
ncbi:FimD/PapC N-terminal domain-containing protein [Escherichia coli]|nr:FimD/PapC N-terminal domain-containing protein [Escherichia coli]MCQ6614309.1 FimD/PapC N-terminal domain-containing protein [Escherichia coli]